MMKLGRFISLIGVFPLDLVATAAWAQPGMEPGGGQGRGWGAGDAPPGVCGLVKGA